MESDNVFKGKIKDSTIFDFKELYEFMYHWLVDEGYDVIEKKYTEKMDARGKELEIEWNAYKKVSDYFRFRINVRWYINSLVDVEVEENGKKRKMNKGTIEIKFAADLEKDYEHRWENNPIAKFLRNVYDRYVIRGRIEYYEGRIFSETDELIAQVKSFLAIEGMH